MAAITMQHFDTLNFVKKSKELGAPEALAEFQAVQIEHAIDIAITNAKYDIKNKEIATKGDMEINRQEIKQVELKLQKEIRQVELTLQKEIEIVRKEIFQLKHDTLKLVVWTGVLSSLFVVSSLSGVLYTVAKLMLHA
jgi:hypothetical protein